EIEGPLVARGMADGSSRDVHVEAQVEWIRAFRVPGAEVCLAHLDGAVAGLPQQAGQRHIILPQALPVPCRRAVRAAVVGGLVDPVRRPVAGRVLSGDERDAAR